MERKASKTVTSLNLLVGSGVLSLRVWMPEDRDVQAPLWLVVAPLSVGLVDQRMAGRL